MEDMFKRACMIVEITLNLNDHLHDVERKVVELDNAKAQLEKYFPRNYLSRRPKGTIQGLFEAIKVAADDLKKLQAEAAQTRFYRRIFLVRRTTALKEHIEYLLEKTEREIQVRKSRHRERKLSVRRGAQVENLEPEESDSLVPESEMEINSRPSMAATPFVGISEIEKSGVGLHHFASELILAKRQQQSNQLLNFVEVLQTQHKAELRAQQMQHKAELRQLEHKNRAIEEQNRKLVWQLQNNACQCLKRKLPETQTEAAYGLHTSKTKKAKLSIEDAFLDSFKHVGHALPSSPCFSLVMEPGIYNSVTGSTVGMRGAMVNFLDGAYNPHKPCFDKYLNHSNIASSSKSAVTPQVGCDSSPEQQGGDMRCTSMTGLRRPWVKQQKSDEVEIGVEVIEDGDGKRREIDTKWKEIDPKWPEIDAVESGTTDEIDAMKSDADGRGEADRCGRTERSRSMQWTVVEAMETRRGDGVGEVGE